MSQEVTPQFAIDYLLDDCEDCPENKNGECVTEFHCFEVKQMCIKALRGELKGEQTMNYEQTLEQKKKKYEQWDCEECSETDCSYREESSPDYCPNLEGDREGE